MTHVERIGTYLPPWGSSTRRVPGSDEDAVTMAVAAGLAALSEANSASVSRVVFVSRDLPLLDGGNGAVLLAGLGLAADISVSEQVGGAPAVLDVVAAAAAGTLVVAADLEPAGAGAVLVGDQGVRVELVRRHVGSLPVRSRGRDGVERDYDDPRLEWASGGRTAYEALALDHRPTLVAGISSKQAKTLTDGDSVELPVLGASAAILALAHQVEARTAGTVAAIEQATAVAVDVDEAAEVLVVRDEPVAQEVPKSRKTPGPEIGISLAAYERAFEPKTRWEAGSCNACGELSLPPRMHCLACGSEDGWTLTPLPRAGEVYTGVTVHVPVPGLATPYSLVIVELDDVAVRALVRVTGVPAGSTAIGDRGRILLRRVAMRSGVPDYAYALLPDLKEAAA